MANPELPDWVEEPPILVCNRRIDELARVQAKQAHEICWLKAEVARLASVVAGVQHGQS